MQHIVRQAAPMTPQILRILRRKLNLSNPSDATFWALFLIAFFTMTHKSNLVPDRADLFNPEMQLSREKVLVGNGYLLVFWTWAKNIQNRDRAHKIPILQIPGSPLCPVTTYKNMCELIPLKKHQAAFSLISSTGPVPVTYSQFNGKLKQLSKHAASTGTITQHTAFGGVWPHALSEPRYLIPWFSCKVTGLQIVIKDTWKWVWWRSGMFLWN